MASEAPKVFGGFATGGFVKATPLRRFGEVASEQVTLSLKVDGIQEAVDAIAKARNATMREMTVGKIEFSTYRTGNDSSLCSYVRDGQLPSSDTPTLTWDGLPAGSRGDWMQTSQGRQFWPLDPRVEDVHIEDIAAALARMCRYGGQLRDDVEFYSVAEHSVHVAAAAPSGLKLAALLHDATEAYLQDIIRPVKPFLRDYASIEERLAVAIGHRFGLTLHPLPAEVKRLDNAILADERDQVMAKPPTDWRLIEPALGVQIHGWLPNKARFEFLAAFRRYGGHWS